MRRDKGEKERGKEKERWKRKNEERRKKEEKNRYEIGMKKRITGHPLKEVAHVKKV